MYMYGVCLFSIWVLGRWIKKRVKISVPLISSKISTLFSHRSGWQFGSWLHRAVPQRDNLSVTCELVPADVNNPKVVRLTDSVVLRHLLLFNKTKTAPGPDRVCASFIQNCSVPTAIPPSPTIYAVGPSLI